MLQIPKRKENILYGIILCPLNLNGKITEKKYLVDLEKLEHDSLEKQDCSNNTYECVLFMNFVYCFTQKLG